MKRYRINFDYGRYYFDKRDDGDWVRFEDHEAEIQRLRDDGSGARDAGGDKCEIAVRSAAKIIIRNTCVCEIVALKCSHGRCTTAGASQIRGSETEMLISYRTAHHLLAGNRAKVEGRVYREDNDTTYLILTRYDLQRTDRVKIGRGDLRDREPGCEARK